jgi:hypothetical protein
VKSRSRWIAAFVIVVLVIAGAAVVGGLAIARSSSGGRPSVALGTPQFVDITQASGVANTYDGDYPLTIGGGVAVLDCDADGRPDLYLAGGSRAATLYRNDTPPGGSPHFSLVRDPATDLTDVTGAYPLDIDGDGNVDLVVLRRGGNVLLRGLGGCRFEAANERWGFDGGYRITLGFSATWEASSRLPTLAFGNFLLDPDNPDPDNLCAANVLVRPAADGVGYGPPVPLTPSWCAQSMLFSDWDRSGRRDLRVSNDRQYYSDLSDGEEQLWRMAPGGAPRLYTSDDGWAQVRIYGMGIGSYDVNGDGYPDAYLTSQGPNLLQNLASGPGQPAFRDISLSLGVSATRPSTGGDPLASTSWHPEFADVNNDGLIDLFVSKGNVGTQEGYATKDPSELFLGRPDGTFGPSVADSSGILSFARGRGAALVDLDGDGLLDLVEANVGDPVRLWRNVGAGSAAAPLRMGHWLGIRASEPGPNVDAIGAWIDIAFGDSTIHRELTVGGGHSGGQLGPIHVGIGAATTARVRVTWPEGQVGPWIDVGADRIVAIARGSDTATPPASGRP